MIERPGLFAPLGSVQVIEVAPGTEIEHDGQKLTVTDTQAVRKGDRFYVTPKQLAAIKAHPKVTLQ